MPCFDQTTKTNDRQQKKRTCQIVKESEKRDKYTDLAWELEKSVEYESDSDTNCDKCAWYSHQRNDTVNGGLGN